MTQKDDWNDYEASVMWTYILCAITITIVFWLSDWWER